MFKPNRTEANFPSKKKNYNLTLNCLPIQFHNHFLGYILNITTQLKASFFSNSASCCMPRRLEVWSPVVGGRRGGGRCGGGGGGGAGAPLLRGVLEGGVGGGGGHLRGGACVPH